MAPVTAQAVAVAAEAFERRPEPVVEARPAPVFEPRPEPIVERKPEPIVAPRPERIVSPTVTAAPPPPPPAPRVDLDSALRESGLVMIQTKADRVAPLVEVEEPPAPRPRRERRPPPADLNAPLTQVETQKSPGATPES